MANNSSLTKKELQELLVAQTETILNVVDFKLTKTDKRLARVEVRLAGLGIRMGEVEARLGKVEKRLNQKLDKLITSLDKFLKRLTDNEDEFAMMKEDINRLKTIVREKLGVAV